MSASQSAHRIVLHVDMDAFYAAVEVRDHPELRDLPVVVGGSPDGRGVVAAASYAARRYGIHSAMPARTARQRCPHAVFLPPRHDHYARVSREIRRILARYTPLVEPLALDEAFLDVTASLRLWGSGRDIARGIKSAIREELQLTASVGVAPNKFVAKIASDIEKPDGLVVVGPAQVCDFLDPLPVTRVWGVGDAAARKLQALGVTTMRQLRQVPVEVLERQLGRWGRQIRELARGRDERSVVAEREARSLSHEVTFESDLHERDKLMAVLHQLSDRVARRLRGSGTDARTVTIKLRYADFVTVTRTQTLSAPTRLSREIYGTARALLDTALGDKTYPVRLLGVGVSGLGTAPRQGELFPDRQQGRQTVLDRVMDEVAEKFGAHSLHRGPHRNQFSSPRSHPANRGRSMK